MEAFSQLRSLFPDMSTFVSNWGNQPTENAHNTICYFLLDSFQVFTLGSGKLLNVAKHGNKQKHLFFQEISDKCSLKVSYAAHTVIPNFCNSRRVRSTQLYSLFKDEVLENNIACNYDFISKLAFS